MRHSTRPFASLGLAATLILAALPAHAGQTVHHDDDVLHVEVHGQGRPVILIPGLASAGEAWQEAVRRHPDWQCHVVTLGGFAGTPPFQGPFLETARDALISYLKHERLDHPIVIGHSLGGVLALQMAIAEPDALGSLVVMDALPFLGGAAGPEATPESAAKAMAPVRDMIRGQTQEQYETFQKQSPFLKSMVTGAEDLERIRAWGLTSDHVAVAEAMYEVNTTDLRAGLGKIREPLLVIGTWAGMKGFTTRARVDSTFRAQYANATRWHFVLADSARHFVMLDAPDWTWNTVDAYLADPTAMDGPGGER
jgi:pimeloyl-ACP methyl ester carboxylesterase